MRKRMIRLAAVVLACGMIFVLGACGDKSDVSPNAQAEDAEGKAVQGNEAQTADADAGDANGQEEGAQADGAETGASQTGGATADGAAADDAAADDAQGNPQTGTDGIGNPWVDYDNMEEACNAAGFTFNVPETVSSYVGLHFSVMNNEMIQVMYGEPGTCAIVRKGTGAEDISGDYGEYAEVQEVDVNGTTVKMSGNDGLVSNAIWEKDGYSYAVVVTDEENPGLSQESMTEVVRQTF